MKQLLCLLGGSWLFLSTIAQTATLCITTDKTTSLVFPFSIKHVDRGTNNILVQQVKEADNILLVKAAKKGFPETNLSVITEDGNVYTFGVNYEEKPIDWVITLPGPSKTSIASYANNILNNPKSIKSRGDKKWNIKASLIGIYIKDKVIFYQLELENESAIDYDLDVLGFYIRDKIKGKRTAVQEIDVKPLYIAGNYSQVKADQKNTIVVALDKFTIPDEKLLVVQIMEKNGGRHLKIKIDNNQIMQAKTLSDFK